MTRTIVNPANGSALSSPVVRNELQILENEVSSGTDPGHLHTTLTTLTAVGTLTVGSLGAGFSIGGVTVALGSDANYDLYYRNSSGILTRLAAGTPGFYLSTNGTGSAPVWVAAPGGTFSNPMTTLGDLIYGGASGVATRLAGDATNARVFLIEQSSGGTATAPVWSSIQVGDLPTVTVAKGGTGLTSLLSHAVYVGNGTGNVSAVSVGSPGQVLTSNGSSADPSFQSNSLITSGNSAFTAAGNMTEQTVFTASISGNTLGTFNEVAGKLIVTAVNGNAITVTVRVYYGATVIATFPVTFSSSFASIPGLLTFSVIANGSTNSQVGTATFIGGSAEGVGAGTYVVVNSAAVANGVGTAAVDSTTSQNLKVTVQSSSNVFSFTSTVYSVSLIH